MAGEIGTEEPPSKNSAQVKQGALHALTTVLYKGKKKLCLDSLEPDIKCPTLDISG